MKKRILILMVLCVFLVVGCKKEENVVQTIANTEETETVVETEETETVVETETKAETELETKVETEAVESKPAETKDYEKYILSIKEQSDAIKNSLKNDALSQTEMNLKSQELYELWDGALNYFWNELQNVLTAEEYEKLLDEQLKWIEDKENAVEEAGKEVEGGTMHPLVVNSEAAEITEVRVYEFYVLLQ